MTAVHELACNCRLQSTAVEYERLLDHLEEQLIEIHAAAHTPALWDDDTSRGLGRVRSIRALPEPTATAVPEGDCHCDAMASVDDLAAEIGYCRNQLESIDAICARTAAWVDWRDGVGMILAVTSPAHTARRPIRVVAAHPTYL